jgi:hypothetical protein
MREIQIFFKYDKLIKFFNWKFMQFMQKNLCLKRKLIVNFKWLPVEFEIQRY